MAVYFVGIGIGDPDLLTISGRALVEKAQVAVFDSTEGEAIAELAPTQCLRIAIDPAKGAEALMEVGNQYETVVRLIDLDPVTSSQAHRESLAIENQGVLWEMVPGVKSLVPPSIGWLKHRPLNKRTIVVTRAAEQAPELVSQLKSLGAQVLQAPTIAIADPADGGVALHSAMANVSDYEWLVVTSPNGARRTMEAVRDARQLGGVKVAAIGPATAQVLAEYKLVADLIPPKYVAESLLKAMGSPSTPGAKVLLSRAAVARDVLPVGLNEAGWEVDVVEAYRTVAPVVSDTARTALKTADTITFTSSSTVSNFAELYAGDLAPGTKSPVAACIGPITAETARQLGFQVGIEAKVHTIDGLVDAIVEHAVANKRG